MPPERDRLLLGFLICFVTVALSAAVIYVLLDLAL